MHPYDNAKPGRASSSVSTVTRSVPTWVTLTALMLVAGCGGGSANKTTGTQAPSAKTGGIVSAKEGAFRTVIPPTYRQTDSPAQYYVVGTEEDGFAPSLVVVREKARGGISALARDRRRTYRTFLHRVSRLEASSVDGNPAFALGYTTKGTGTQKGKEFSVRQVLVKNGQWLYIISAISLPTQAAASRSSLNEVIQDWHWQ
jgi:hypothetical protein